MKLVNYDANQRLTTINGNTSAPVSEMAYGANQQGLSQLGKAIGDMGSTMLQIQKQKEMVDVVKAANEYSQQLNDWMYNPDTGAMNRKGENALSIPVDYDMFESKARRELAERYNFKTADAINAFNKVVDNDRTNTLNSINGYVRKQYESSALTALDTNIENITNNAVVNASPDAFNTGLTQLSGSITAQLKNLGFDDNAIESQVKKNQQILAQTMIEKKIADDDLDGANNVINTAAMSGLIDEKNIMEYRQKVRKATMVLATGNEQTIRDVIGKYDPNDPDLLTKVTDDLFNSGFGKVAGGSGNATIEDLKAAIMGQESGGDAAAVNGRTGAYGLFQILSDNWAEWSAEAGIPGADMSDPEAQKKVAAFKMGQYANKFGVDGAIVAWYAGPGNGQRWKDGEPDAIGDDGQHYSWDAPQGAGDEPSVRQYLESVKGRLFSGESREETPLEAQQRKEMIQRNVSTQLQRIAKSREIALENQSAEVEQKVAAALSNGGTAEDALKIRQDYAATHPEYARKYQGQLNTQQISVNAAAAKAKIAKDINVDGVYSAISNGQITTQAALNNYIQATGLYYNAEQIQKIQKKFDDYVNGEGEYSPKMARMTSAIEELNGNKLTPMQKQGLNDAVYPKVQEYRNTHDQQDPPAYLLQQWGSEAMSEMTIATNSTGEFWGAGRISNFFGGKGSTISISPAEQASYGIASFHNATGADGQPYIVYKERDGTEYTVTPEDFLVRIGRG